MTPTPHKFQSLTVGGQKVSVVYKPLKGKWGKFDGDKARITIHPELLGDVDRYMSVLVHEILHAALYYAGLTCNSAPIVESAPEEAVVCAIESLALPALRRVITTLS